MRILAIFTIILAFTTMFVYYLYAVSETRQGRIGTHVNENLYEVDFNYQPELYDLSEYQAKGLFFLSAVLAASAGLLSLLVLGKSKKIKKLDEEIDILQRQIRVKELQKSLN